MQLGAETDAGVRTRVELDVGDAARQAKRLARELAMGGLKRHMGGTGRWGCTRTRDFGGRGNTSSARCWGAQRICRGTCPSFTGTLLGNRYKNRRHWDFFYWEKWISG